MTPDEMTTVLRHLHPDADHVYQVRVDVAGGVPTLAHWGLPGDPPTEAQLLAALPAAQALAAARQDLRDTQAMLDDRYRLYNRANARGNTAAAAEIQTEITDLLDYMKELRNAPNPA